MRKAPRVLCQRGLSSSLFFGGNILNKSLRARSGVGFVALQPDLASSASLSSPLSHRSMPHQGTPLLLHLWQRQKSVLGARAVVGRDVWCQGGFSCSHSSLTCGFCGGQVGHRTHPTCWGCSVAPAGPIQAGPPQLPAPRLPGGEGERK